MGPKFSLETHQPTDISRTITPVPPVHSPHIANKVGSSALPSHLVDDVDLRKTNCFNGSFSSKCFFFFIIDLSTRSHFLKALDTIQIPSSDDDALLILHWMEEISKEMKALEETKHGRLAT